MREQQCRFGARQQFGQRLRCRCSGICNAVQAQHAAVEEAERATFGRKDGLSYAFRQPIFRIADEAESLASVMSTDEAG